MTPATTLQPRYQPAVAQISSSEIAIMGGWSREGYSRLGDVVLFDATSNTCKLVVKHNAIKLNAVGNQCG